MAYLQNPRLQHLETLQEFPDTLAGLVLQLTDDELFTEYLPGEWTVNQIVQHLVDAHMQGFFRFKMVLTSEKPNFQIYPQDEFAKTPEYDLIAIDEALEAISLLHDRWTLMLGNLEESDWARKGVHPVRGEMSVDDLAEMYANHCTVHLDQIRKTLAARPGQ